MTETTPSLDIRDFSQAAEVEQVVSNIRAAVAKFLQETDQNRVGELRTFRKQLTALRRKFNQAREDGAVVADDYEEVEAQLLDLEKRLVAKIVELASDTGGSSTPLQELKRQNRERHEKSVVEMVSNYEDQIAGLQDYLLGIWGDIIQTKDVPRMLRRITENADLFSSLLEGYTLDCKEVFGVHFLKDEQLKRIYLQIQEMRRALRVLSKVAEILLEVVENRTDENTTEALATVMPGLSTAATQLGEAGKVGEQIITAARESLMTPNLGESQ